MKITKKIISILLALTMTLGMMIPAFALLPDSLESEGDASETVIVPVEFEDILSLDGKFELDDPNGIVKDFQVDYPTEWGGTNPANGKFIYYTDGKDAKTIVLTFKVTLTDDVAKNGSTAKIIINYNYTTKSVPTETSKTHTVTIELKVEVDYTALNTAIARAEGLNQKDYDQGDGKWAAMQTALANAKALVNNTLYKADVDAATVALNDAIDALTPLEFADLLALIAEIKNLSKYDYTSASMLHLDTVLANVEGALGSMTTNAAIEAAYGELSQAKNALVNVASLKALLAQAKAIVNIGYPLASWNNLQSAISYADSLLVNGTANQVIYAASWLNDAMAALVPLNYDELLTVIAAAEQLNQDDYLEDTWSYFSGVLTSAKNLIGNATSQIQINNMKDDLEEAIDKLVTHIEALDYSVLNAYLAYIASLDPEAFTADSWAKLQEVVNEAKALIGNVTRQYMIDGKVTELIDALDALRTVWDYSALFAAIDKAEALDQNDYTTASWEGMQVALTVANNLVYKAKTQEVIDEAAVALENALAALVDISSLNALLDEINALNSDDYTTVSWANLMATVASSEAVLNNGTQAQVNAAQADVQAAIDALVNVSGLKAAIAKGEAIKNTGYTEESWNALQTAIAAGKTLLDICTQEQADSEEIAILAAIDALVEPAGVQPPVGPFDYEELKAAIAAAKAIADDNYTASSWNAFQAAISAADAIVDKATDEAQITVALDALVKAQAALVKVAPTFNYDALNAAIDSTAALVATDYTAESWAELMKALGAAEALVGKAATQDDIDAAVAALNAAVAGLEEIEIILPPTLNYDALNGAIEDAKALVAGAYTAETWAELMKALGAAEAINGKAATQDDIDAAVAALNAAVEALELAPVDPVLNYEALNGAIEDAKALFADAYTAETWAELMKALGAAEAINGKAATQDDIDVAVAALNAAIKALQAAPGAPVVDYDALNDAIASVQGLIADTYTAETWAELMKALGAAEALVGKAASQDEVDAATAALKAAIKGLKLAPEAPTPDYDALYEAIKAARKLDETKYTAETWADLMKALGAAEAVNGMAATQDEIDAACEALKAATKALKEKPAAPALNYADLNAAINAVKALKAADYTAETWADLMKALGAAEAVNGNAATQQEITDALSALNAAKNALKKPTTINYTALQNAINDFGKLNKNNYSADAWASIQAVVEAAKAINGKAASQSQVDAVVAAYNAAKAATLKPVAIDYAELNAQIAVANGLKQADYTAATWQEVQSALNAAKALVNKAKTQSEADVAAYALKDAIASLVKIAPTMNTTELDNQLQIAQGLVQKDYTAATWAAVAAALEAAEEAKAGTDQAAIDNAAKALKDAMAGLVKMNFSALQDALNAVNTHAGNKEISGIWNEMHDLLVKAQELMLTGDQAAVDQCVADLAAKLAEIEAEVEKLEKVEQVEVKVEVPVEPTDPYCNKGAHTVWIILMWVSVAINVAAVALVVTYFVLKKKKEGDETPLVEYDIDDDAETDDKE